MRGCYKFSAMNENGSKDAYYFPNVPPRSRNDVLERLGRLILSGFPNVAIDTPWSSTDWDIVVIVDSRGRDTLPTHVSTILQKATAFLTSRYFL